MSKIPYILAQIWSQIQAPAGLVLITIEYRLIVRQKRSEHRNAAEASSSTVINSYAYHFGSFFHFSEERCGAVDMLRTVGMERRKWAMLTWDRKDCQDTKEFE
jgi:hypothetical protein